MGEVGTFVSPEVIRGRPGEKKQYTLWIDLEYCIGCKSCTVACKSENNTPVGLDYNRVIDVEYGEFSDPRKPPPVRAYFVPMPCMH